MFGKIQQKYGRNENNMQIKLRDWVKFDGCRAHHYIYLMNNIGASVNTIKDDAKYLYTYTYGGYLCGNNPDANQFFMERKLQYNDHIES